ncbi:MAG TPA: M3 family oligoendopeptidase [Candidatus Dormibacteraeota bacterium]|nr:M3 family oligoendopeptidase [Candidatus Dormibacteraeota bacterium]
MIAAPQSPRDLARATWTEIEPHYEQLAARPMDDVDGWLRAWSRFEEILSEAGALASVAYTCDTTDPVKEAAHLRFTKDIGPRALEQRVRLGRRLLATGHSAPDLDMILRRMRNQEELFRKTNVPLLGELQELSSAWQKLAAGLSATWDGRSVPLPALRVHEASPDRQVRERAYKLHLGAFASQRDAIEDIFDRQYQLRQTVAHNAGFANYRDYAHAEKNRFDYTPGDCERFHDAVEQTVVPAVERIMARRRELMGLDCLQPWDGIDGLTGVADPLGRPPLRPFADVEALTARAHAVFAQVDANLGGYFEIMRREGLVDLDGRQGKAPGGYCTSFAFRRRPFIFMNATGTDSDVRTLLHESGHAFHSFEAHASQPLIFQRHPGSEMAEVASMSMELLAAPYLGQAGGGFFSPEDQKRSRADHLQGILVVLAHIASVDAFQHWIYTSGEGHDRDARDRQWTRLRERFQPGVDWTGNNELRVARWLAQPHFFTHPFYYIEYGIAQLGALQVWRNSMVDQAGTVAAYRGALALGGTRPLPGLFEAAGARMVFDAEQMGQLVSLVEERL